MNDLLPTRPGVIFLSLVLTVMLSGCGGRPNRPQPRAPGTNNGEAMPPAGPAPAGLANQPLRQPEPANGRVDLGLLISALVAGQNGVSQSALYAPGHGGEPQHAAISTLVVDNMAFIGIATETARGKQNGWAAADQLGPGRGKGATIDPGQGVEGSPTTMPQTAGGAPTLRTGLVDAIKSRVTTAFPQVHHVYVTTNPKLVGQLLRVTGDDRQQLTTTDRLQIIMTLTQRMAATAEGPASPGTP